MYLSKHQGGNAVSTADHFDPNEAKKWKREVLEAYLGVTLKRVFSIVFAAKCFGFAITCRSAPRTNAAAIRPRCSVSPQVWAI